jgi:hypothetical protein
MSGELRNGKRLRMRLTKENFENVDDDTPVIWRRPKDDATWLRRVVSRLMNLIWRRNA